jgi:hypothetical protein
MFRANCIFMTREKLGKRRSARRRVTYGKRKRSRELHDVILEEDLSVFSQGTPVPEDYEKERLKSLGILE